MKSSKKKKKIPFVSTLPHPLDATTQLKLNHNSPPLRQIQAILYFNHITIYTRNPFLSLFLSHSPITSPYLFKISKGIRKRIKLRKITKGLAKSIKSDDHPGLWSHNGRSWPVQFQNGMSSKHHGEDNDRKAGPWVDQGLEEWIKFTMTWILHIFLPSTNMLLLLLFFFSFFLSLAHRN